MRVRSTGLTILRFPKKAFDDAHHVVGHDRRGAREIEAPVARIALPRPRQIYADLKRTNPGVFAKLKAAPDDLNEIWLDREKGTTAGDWWNDITPIRKKGSGQSAKEPYCYPTQKPLTLYGRIIVTASNEGDIVLDPFAGCATTCVAAEKLGRQWAGIDIWEKAHQVVVQRLEQEALLGGFKLGSIPLIDEPPERTDDGETASPFLRVKKRVKEPDGPRWTREQMYKHLLEQKGPKCEGCNREFDDSRYLELDHNTPRSDGGLNHISNRVLLCGPCNKLKSNIYTLSGLQKENRKQGYMR